MAQVTSVRLEMMTSKQLKWVNYFTLIQALVFLELLARGSCI